MPGKQQTKGACVFCGREMTRAGITKHLLSCPQRQAAQDAAAASSRPPQSLYHLLVRDKYNPDFWLHLELNGTATLNDLDGYLRAIWLECCGHLSQFSVGGWRGDEIPMNTPIARVFASGVELTHIYDFGTSSETLLKPVAMRQGHPLTDHPVYLMARNQVPDQVCAECGAAAHWYCADCLAEEGEWVPLCEQHCPDHDHDEYGGPSPFVNSPRLGLCGYNGPAEPPY